MGSKNKVWDSLWESYQAISSKDILNEPAGMTQRSEFVGLLLEQFDLRGKSILEVGTGTGQYCIELALRGANCFGIDIDPGSIKLARRLTKDYGIKNCSFKNIDLFDLDKGFDKKFDIVFSMGTLEHFNNKEIVKMLKKMKELGDHVIVGVPFSGSQAYTFSKKQSQQLGTWEYGEEQDFETLAPLFKEAGIHLVKERVIGVISEAMYLKRVNPNLIVSEIAKNLTKKFENGKNDVGSWLIDIGSQFGAHRPGYHDEVSIIVPIYNGEKYIERLANNLSKIAYSNYEIIFVNDCSTDNTKKELDNIYNVQVINLGKNVGEIGARLAGIISSKYDYVYFLDADDMIFPDGITAMMRDLKSCPEGTYLSNSCALMQKGKFTGDIWFHEFLPSPQDYIASELMNLCGKISLGNTIIKKEAILKAYETYDKILEKAGIDRMNVAGDSILLNIMVFNGDIKRILPIYYTYRAYTSESDTASQNMLNRVRDIPLQMAYCFNRTDIEYGDDMIFKISNKALQIYGKKLGKEFMDNFYHYGKALNDLN